jgi:cytochrome c oxidase subunit 2
MRSADVIHSLFIPDFRVKKDVVPGRYSYLWFEAPQATATEPVVNADKDNFHWLFCTEYCGTGHSNMNRNVFVLEQPNFDAWLEKQARWIDDLDAQDLYWAAGPLLYARCAQCHSLDGVDGNGPSWGKRVLVNGDAIWDRTCKFETTFGDGRSLADLIGPGKEYATPEDYIRDSILNPGKHLVKGFGNAMPTFKGQLGDKAIDAIIGFMKHIEEFDPKTGKPKPDSPAGKAAAAAKAAGPKKAAGAKETKP